MRLASFLSLELLLTLLGCAPVHRAGPPASATAPDDAGQTPSGFEESAPSAEQSPKASGDDARGGTAPGSAHTPEPQDRSLAAENEAHLLQTLEGSHRLLTLRAQELDRMFPVAPPRAAAPRTEGSDPGEEAAASASPAAADASTPDCGQACQAFASLERAANAICRLAGTEDARCAAALRTVARHQERVTACACP